MWNHRQPFVLKQRKEVYLSLFALFTLLFVCLICPYLDKQIKLRSISHIHTIGVHLFQCHFFNTSFRKTDINQTDTKLISFRLWIWSLLQSLTRNQESLKYGTIKMQFKSVTIHKIASIWFFCFNIIEKRNERTKKRLELVFKYRHKNLIKIRWKNGLVAAEIFLI